VFHTGKIFFVNNLSKKVAQRYNKILIYPKLFVLLRRFLEKIYIFITIYNNFISYEQC